MLEGVGCRQKRAARIQKLGYFRFHLYRGISQTEKGSLYPKTGFLKFSPIQRYFEDRKGQLVSKNRAFLDFTYTKVLYRLKRATCIPKQGFSRFYLYKRIVQTEKGNLYPKTGLVQILPLQRYCTDWKGQHVSKNRVFPDFTFTKVLYRLKRATCIQNQGSSNFHLYKGNLQTEKGGMYPKTGFLKISPFQRYYEDRKGQLVSQNRVL